MTRQYLKVCESCRGEGIIPAYFATTTSTTKQCPACQGSGVVMVTETVDKSEVDSSPATIEIHKLMKKLGKRNNWRDFTMTDK
jgi:DnaJ-class molecular chaperone